MLSIEQQKKRRDRRNAQAWQNEQCYYALHTVQAHEDFNTYTQWYPLYHCNARLAYFPERDGKTLWIALKSYQTIICIAVYDSDRSRIILYDVLRGMFGYTRASAMHIAKFRRKLLEDYAPNICTTYTLRPERQ